MSDRDREISSRLMFRDPLEILIAKENQTCKGCVLEKEVFGRKYCSKGKKHGRRCKQYSN